MCLYKQEEIFVLKKQKIFWQFYNINNLSFSLVLCVMTFFFARFSGNNDTYWKKGNVILVYENIKFIVYCLTKSFSDARNDWHYIYTHKRLTKIWLIVSKCHVSLILFSPLGIHLVNCLYKLYTLTVHKLIKAINKNIVS